MARRPKNLQNLEKATRVLQWFSSGLIVVLTILFAFTAYQYSRLKQEPGENDFFIMVQLDRETRRLAQEIQSAVTYNDLRQEKLDRIAELYDILFSRIEFITRPGFKADVVRDAATVSMVGDIATRVRSSIDTFDKLSEHTTVSIEELAIANESVQAAMAVSERLIPHVGNMSAAEVTQDRNTLVYHQAYSALFAVLSLGCLGALILVLRKQVAAIGNANRENQDRADGLQLEIEQAVRDIRAREEEIIECLSVATGHKDAETSLHTKRVAYATEQIALRLDIPAQDARDLRLASLMHDIGKVGIPDYILEKKSRLTDQEMAIMRTHTTIGENILSESKSELLQLAAKVAGSHHERWDGSGYPARLAGEDIPLAGRIVALADTYDALTSVRPYKAAWSLDKVLEHIDEEAGRHFDPRCVAALKLALGDIQEIYSALPEGQTPLAVNH